MISRSSGDRGELKSEAMTFPFFLLTLMVTIRGTSENNAHYSARERRNWMPNVLLRPAGPSDPGQMPVFRLSGIHCQRNESVPVVRTVKFGREVGTIRVFLTHVFASAYTFERIP